MFGLSIIDRFDFLPKPHSDTDEITYGVQPRVCCPQVLLQDSICFPTDPFCPIYQDKKNQTRGRPNRRPYEDSFENLKVGIDYLITETEMILILDC